MYLCDRGSTHHRYQAEIIAEEHRLWGIEAPTPETIVTEREEECYEIADAISVPSSVASRSCIAMGVPESKGRVIPYGVRLDLVSGPEEPEVDSFEVLFAGQISLRKGVPYLLEAFAKVKHPRKHLTLVGSMSGAVRSLLDKLPQDAVTFTGSLPQAELFRRMRRSQVLVLPSIEEGLALVQGQAMACGCAIVATVETGSEDLFTHGQEGFIVPCRDRDALAEAIQQLADDPELLKSMRAKALERVKFLGGWDRYGDSWEILLQSLLARTTRNDRPS